jgi:CDP-paratose synthetase
MSPDPRGPVTLLTGGTGFLGSHLLRRLLAEDVPVVLLKRSFSSDARIRTIPERYQTWDLDTTDIQEVFQRYDVGRIIHCATNYGVNDSAPWKTIEANLILPLKLIHLAKQAGVGTFVNTDTILNKRINHYSLSKNQFIDWMQNYAVDLACINIAIEHFYGPEDDPSKFVTRVLLDLLKGKPSLALTPGEQRRDFIYVDDVIEGFMRILQAHAQSSSGYYAYQVGTGQSISIREFVELAKRLTGNRNTVLAFGALKYRPNEVMNSAVDTGALCALGWQPRYTLEEGLVKTLEQNVLWRM